MKPTICTFSKWACWYGVLAFELCWEYLTCSGDACWHLVFFNQGISLDWFSTERLSGAVSVSYGSGASAVWLLLKELVISKGANISAHLTIVYLGGPPLALDLALFGFVVSDPLSMVSLFVDVGHCTPRFNIWVQHFKVRWRISLPKMNIFAQSAVTFAPSNIQLYSTLHPMSYITFLFDFSDLSFSSTHKFLQRNSVFWGEDLFVNFQTFHFIFRLIEPLWLIMWSSVVTHDYFKYIPSQRLISFAFACGLCHWFVFFLCWT